MKSLVEEKAKRFLNLPHSANDYNRFIEKFNAEIYSLHTAHDQLVYLSIISDEIQIESENHKKVCTMKKNCPTDYGYLEIIYHLNHFKRKLGVINSDEFSSNEKQHIEEKFEDLIKRYESLGKEVESIREELNDLKAHFYLGKKRWWQFSRGKFGEMISQGILDKSIEGTIDLIIDSVKQISV